MIFKIEIKNNKHKIIIYEIIFDYSNGEYIKIKHSIFTITREIMLEEHNSKKSHRKHKQTKHKKYEKKSCAKIKTK